LWAVAAVLVIGLVLRAQAASVTLAWEAPTLNVDGTALTNLAGFKLYQGAATGIYGNPTDAGNVTTQDVTGLEDGVTYYFAVTAYNTLGLESDPSDELAWTAPDVTGPVIEWFQDEIVLRCEGANNVAPCPDLGEIVRVTDNVSGGEGITLTQSPAIGTPLPVGIHALTLTATDEAGNATTDEIDCTVFPAAVPAAPTRLRVVSGDGG